MIPISAINPIMAGKEMAISSTAKPAETPMSDWRNGQDDEGLAERPESKCKYREDKSHREKRRLKSPGEFTAHLPGRHAQSSRHAAAPGFVRLPG